MSFHGLSAEPHIMNSDGVLYFVVIMAFRAVNLALFVRADVSMANVHSMLLLNSCITFLD